MSLSTLRGIQHRLNEYDRALMNDPANRAEFWRSVAVSMIKELIRTGGTARPAVRPSVNGIPPSVMDRLSRLK